MKNALGIKVKNISLDWDKIGNNLLSITWQLVITTIIFYLISHFGKKIINRYLNSRPKRNTNKRTQTITALINSVFQYTVIFFYLFGVLSILGVPVGTLLASAGIFSLALGMGAQGFVSDLVNGFFILSEDQYDVGDLVQIGTSVGTVVQLGLRTTRLKASDGSMIYIPNRNITVVQNLAHGGIGLDLTLDLDASNDINKVEQLIKECNRDIKVEKKTIIQGPTIVGITEQTGKKFVYQIHFQVKPGKQSVVRNLYLAKYIQVLQENNIKFADEPVVKTTLAK
ncbi:mechanosensitive ion channel family protein [Lactobacillus kalixensis]|uniref:Small-conductance mechanosensitive channel protein n=1 Tax=Lactobacillus kalixensis DSM 16043 TaxID=1423763 RepID=A0A0R1UKG7_9LACO|nr:mechanosensitive ion channel family protein [Lactobacillus kalixensis]KRL91266.1 small-conductance mechanosensitive channel protein [Lactobacillus kalixensis DSM 16043]